MVEALAEPLVRDRNCPSRGDNASGPDDRVRATVGSESLSGGRMPATRCRESLSCWGMPAPRPRSWVIEDVVAKLEHMDAAAA
jgi:hypothetical protein